MSPRAAADSSSLLAPAGYSRSAAVDLIKALAILSVICLHSLSTATLDATAATFYIWQAVPVFVVLLGINGAASLRRRGGSTLRELYLRDYLAPRFDRVYIPFLLAFAGTVLVVGLVRVAHYSFYGLIGDLLSGQLPIDGPGNYFITLLFQAVLLLPLLYWGMRRRPLPVLLLCLAITVGYEALALHVGLASTHPLFYEACVARYLLLMAVGCALADVSAKHLLRAWWLWCGALLGAAYLALDLADPGAVEVGAFSATALYPALLVVLGMRGLQWVSGPAMHVGVEVGRASYHTFLVQIVWFGLGVWSIDSLPALAGNLAVTIAAGVAFYELMSRAPLPSLADLLARRRELSLAQGQTPN